MASLAEHPSTRGRRVGLIRATIAAIALVAVGLTASPAAALHQHCGRPGIGLGYPAGTLQNGHPDTTRPASDHGWAGVHAKQKLEKQLEDSAQAVIALNYIDQTLGWVNEIIEAGIKDSIVLGPLAFIPQAALEVAEAVVSGIQLGIKVAIQALAIADKITTYSLADVNKKINNENACRDVLTTDMHTMQWVSLVERNLSSDGPPLAILMAPHSSNASTDRPWPLLPQHEAGDFAWCPSISLPEELPAQGSGGSGSGSGGGGDCTPEHHTGFLDAPKLGVKQITTAVVAHAATHGVDGAEHDGSQHGETAVELLAHADSLLGQERYAEAFYAYRAAYQEAMRLDQ